MKTSRPNLILLTLDTLRFDRLGCNGASGRLTPNLDRLVEKGVNFVQAISGGSWTQAAFPVILTSSNASMYGGCSGRLSAERPCPVAALSEHGYDTVGFSTSPLLSADYGFDRGFQEFFDLNPRDKDPRLRGLKGGQRLLRSLLFQRAAAFFGRALRPASLYVSAEDVTNAALEWMTGRSRPFFLWAHYMDVHWPYHRESSDPEEVALAWRDLSALHDVNRGARMRDQQRERLIALYEDAVAYLDSQVGRLMDYLRESGLEEQTLVAVVSDHGEEFMEHGRWGHWEDNLFEEILHVPLLLSPPGERKGHCVDRQVRTLDLMPTLLDVAGCDISADLLGESLVPLWTGREEQYSAECAVSEMWRENWHIISVRTERYKYLWDSASPESGRLFDLRSDGGEGRNVASEHPEVVKYLHRKVAETLALAETTRVEDSDPELDERLTRRLKDLGYLH